MTKPLKKKEGKYIGEDRRGKPLYVGDVVCVEQAWEDEAGHYHDECGITVSRVLPDGRLQFRFGDWKTRKALDQKIQAFMNSCEYYAKDVEKD